MSEGFESYLSESEFSHQSDYSERVGESQSRYSFRPYTKKDPFLRNCAFCGKEIKMMPPNKHWKNWHPTKHDCNQNF